MTEKAVRRMAQKSRTHLKKRINELSPLFPKFPPIKCLTDEQVLKILQCLALIDLEVAKVNIIVSSNSLKIEATDNPTEYLQLMFASAN